MYFIKLHTILVQSVNINKMSSIRRVLNLNRNSSNLHFVSEINRTRNPHVRVLRILVVWGIIKKKKTPFFFPLQFWALEKRLLYNINGSRVHYCAHCDFGLHTTVRVKCQKKNRPWLWICHMVEYTDDSVHCIRFKNKCRHATVHRGPSKIWWILFQRFRRQADGIMGYTTRCFIAFCRCGAALYGHIYFVTYISRAHILLSNIVIRFAVFCRFRNIKRAFLRRHRR